MLAERIGVSASTASESIRKLADQGLVDHEKYGAVTLTDAGRRAALAMVRRHRLMETFLVNELGYSWDEVHDEAEVLEHAVSDRMLDRIDAKLGHPTRDPHGDPIPAADGQVPTPPARQLSVCQDGDAGVVARISDADPEMLRYFDSVGISLDSRLRVLARRDFAGMISVAIEVRRRQRAPRSTWVVLRQKRSGWSANPAEQTQSRHFFGVSGYPYVCSRVTKASRAAARPPTSSARRHRAAARSPGRRAPSPRTPRRCRPVSAPGRAGCPRSPRRSGRGAETPAGRPRRGCSSAAARSASSSRVRASSSPKRPTLVRRSAVRWPPTPSAAPTSRASARM